MYFDNWHVVSVLRRFLTLSIAPPELHQFPQDIHREAHTEYVMSYIQKPPRSDLERHKIENTIENHHNGVFSSTYQNQFNPNFPLPSAASTHPTSNKCSKNPTNKQFIQQLHKRNKTDHHLKIAQSGNLASIYISPRSWLRPTRWPPAIGPNFHQSRFYVYIIMMKYPKKLHINDQTPKLM